MGVSTAAFVLAAFAVSWLVVGAVQAWWGRKMTKAWRRQLATMTPDERREWRAWWVRDQDAAEAWMLDKATQVRDA